MALEEALINALYHGNLELPAEELVETRKCLHEGKSCPLIEDRRQEAPYCDRKILVGVDLTHEQAQFVVRDQGQGFDTSSLPDVGSADALTADGGRGLVLIRTFMDEVTFAEGGREIRMILRRKK